MEEVSSGEGDAYYVVMLNFIEFYRVSKELSQISTKLFVGTRDAESLFFCRTPTISNSRVRKFRTPHSDSDTGSKNLDSDSGPKIRLQLCLWDLLCDIIIVYLRMT